MAGKLIKQATEFKNGWNKSVDDVSIGQNISIIIPVYYPEHLKEVLNHLAYIGGYQEIILVDDSGLFDEYSYDYLEQFKNVKVIYHNKNLGRPAARNTGVSYSNGDILVFLDQDMFLSPDFLMTVEKYYYTNKSMIFLGLRDTLPYEEIPQARDWQNPDMVRDWRIRTEVMPEFIDLTVLKVGNAFNGCKPHEIIYIADSTDNLRKMGILADDTLGFWDLPSMVVSHSMAISKKDFIKIGGFPEWIQGWGGEDIVLGFLACSAHIPIYLSKCVSYQAYHSPYSGSEETKKEELKGNIKHYREWANSIDDFPVFQFNENRRRGHIWQKE